MYLDMSRMCVCDLQCHDVEEQLLQLKSRHALDSETVKVLEVCLKA